MELNLILFLLSMGTFISYISFIWWKYGVLESISDSWYALPIKYNFLFTLFCWFFVIPVMIMGDNILLFLAGSGIAFVGAAAAFKGMDKWIHFISAGLGIIFSQISIFFDFGLWYINIAFFSLALLLFLLRKIIKKYTWYVEILAFLSIELVLFLSKVI